MSLRVCALALAACIAGCVTPMTAEQQTPGISYRLPDRTLVAVVDDRVRLHEGKPANFMGYVRSMGIPSSWTVKTLMIGNDADKNLTMAQFLTARIVAAFNAAGGAAEGLEIAAPLSDGDAASAMQAHSAARMLTLNVQDWHFDANASWVGRFQFNSDLEAIVQQANGGAAYRERFAERQAIEALGSESWQNMFLQAYRAKLGQILSDAELVAALTAPQVTDVQPRALQAAPAADVQAAVTTEPATTAAH